MKRFCWCAAAGLLLLVAIVLVRSGRRPGQPAPQSTPVVAATPAATAPAAPAAKPAAPAPFKPAVVADTSPAGKFKSWTDEFIGAKDAPAKAALLARGEELARERRDQMIRLVRENPQEALARSVPYGVRKQLPDSIRKWIEEPVQGRGDLAVFGAYPGEQATAGFSPVTRIATINGQQYEAFVYGKRQQQVTRTGIPLNGIAFADVDLGNERKGNILALNEGVLRLLDKEEAKDLQQSGALKSDPLCAVSGQSSRKYNDIFYAQLGLQYLTFCHQAHAIQLNDSLLAAQVKLLADGGDPGPYPTNPPPGTAVNSTQGRKTVLFIRVAFIDDPTEPITEDEGYRLMEGVNQFFVDCSYNTLSVHSVVTPLVTVPQPKAWYGRMGAGQLLVDAREAARLAGYDYRDYDLDAIRHVSVPGFDWGGLAFVGARGVWLQSSGTGVACHEFGHNLGLLHANFWKTGKATGPPNPNSPQPNFPIAAESVLGREDVNAPWDTSTGTPPGDIEYGDPYDTMGAAAGGINQFGAYQKTLLDWLSPRHVRVIEQSETNRLWAFDVPMVTAGRLYALAVHKDFENDSFERDYWLDFRARWTDNPWLQNGIELHWAAWSGTKGSAQLIDSTPNSPNGKTDAAVVIGRTYRDPVVPLFITPIAKGGSNLESWIDVVVNIGPFPGNATPSLSIGADATVVPAGTTVNFTADASDPDGDPLAYYWTFGDETFGTNGPAATKTFNTPGKYVVRCEASDMKGGVASRWVVITVGTPAVYTMSGQVIDLFGNPVANVLVHNSASGSAYRYGYTDSDGYYAIGNVPPGTYTNFAAQLGFRLDPLFNNPVVISGSDASLLDHLAYDIPAVSVEVASDADEGTGTPGEFIFRRNSITGDNSEDLLVYFRVSGTAGQAQFDGMFLGATNAVVIPAGSDSVSVLITPIADSLGTGPRTVTATLMYAPRYTNYSTTVTNTGSNILTLTITNVLTNPGWELIRVINKSPEWRLTYPNYVFGQTAEATMTLVDADPPGEPIVFTATLDDAAVETGNDSASVVFYRYDIRSDLTVYYQAGPPDSGSGYGVASTNDYLPLSGSITIPAGKQYAVLPVIARDDLLVEGNEALSLSVSLEAGHFGPPVATVVIVDDDLPLVTIDASDSVAHESGNIGTFTVTRSGGYSNSLVVNYLVTGTATPGVDYQPQAGQITIPAGQVTASFNVTPLPDNTREGDESVIVFLSQNPTYNIGNPGTARVTIQDAALPTVTLTTVDGGGGEAGNPGSFVITRTGPATNALRVDFMVGGTAVPGSDYSAIGTNVTLQVGILSTNINIIPVNDVYRENEENVIVQLLRSTNYNLGNPNAGTVSISDDDSGLPAVAFMLQRSSVREGDGVAQIAVAISANPAADKTPVVVEWHVIGGSAVNGTDYSLSQTGYCAFVRDGPSITNINVDILANDQLQGTRTVLVRLFDPQFIYTNIVRANGTTTTNIGPMPTNAFLGPYNTHTLTIVDDDLNFVSVEATDPLAREQGGKQGYFTITRTGGTSAALPVRIEITGTAAPRSDYQAITNIVTIPAGTNSVRVYVTPIDDSTEEDPETVVLRLISAPGCLVAGDSTATVFLQDNDGTIQFVLANYDVLESVGTAEVLVQRSSSTNVAVTVGYIVTNGTATAGSDFIAATGVVTFAVGETLKTISVPIVNDAIVEPDETISLQLVNPSGGIQLGGQKNATITIVNDDTEFNFSVLTFRVNENDLVGEAEILRSGVLDRTQYVTFIATNGTADGADFFADEYVVEFLPGETNAFVYVDVFDDNLFEGDEQISLQLRNPSEGSLGSVSNATLVIVDDECKVDFELAGYVVHEYSNTVTLVVRRIGGTVNPITVNFTTSDGTATNGLDYAQTTDTVFFEGDRYVTDTNGTGQIVFVPGDTVRSITIPILDDVEGEGNEQFFVTLSDPQAQAFAEPGSVLIGSNVTATVTILDNETPGNVDYEFSVGSGPNARVRAIALQPDPSGAPRILIGGDFTIVNNVAFSRIARLLPDGNFDGGFNPGTGADSNVWAIAASADGKIYLGGDFTRFNNTNRLRLARLTSEGKLDLSFSNTVNGLVRAIALQTNGQVLIAGDFTQVGGVNRSRIARLNTDGSLDTGFAPDFNDTVRALAVQNNGRILVGGHFSFVNGTNLLSLARLQTNGTLDTTFAHGLLNGPVHAIALQTDARVVIGGGFTSVGATPRGGIARLSTLGALDTSFANAAGADAAVNSIAIASNGKILLGGDFTTFNAVLVNHMARVKNNGALDTIFIAGAGANDIVRAVVTQPDTAVVIGGDFTQVHGVARNYVARLHGDEKSAIATVEFTAAEFTVPENLGPAPVQLVRSGNTNSAFSLTFSTYDLVATNGADYSGFTNVVNFAAGQTSAVVNVGILDDALLEGDEPFGVFISGAPLNVDLSGVTNALVRILDNERAVRFVTTNYIGNESNAAALITLERIGGLSGDSTVTFVTSNGTALAGGDYVATATNVTFASGQSNAVVFVPIIPDTAGEPAETVLLRLFNPVNCFLEFPSNAVLTIVDDDFSFGTITKTNAAAITILDAQPAAPYPSTIAVSGLTGVLAQVRVQLNGVRHAFPSDIDALLVGPNGAKVLLMSDAGGGLPVTNLTLTFDDYANTYLPSNSLLTSTTNRPTDYAPADTFFSPAPAGPYGSELSVFTGISPNGTWSLYILDDRGSDAGVVSNGWRLLLTTVDLTTVADLGVHGVAAPPSAPAGTVIKYSFTMTNGGPNAASDVVLSNPLPANFTVLSTVAPAGGACGVSNNAVICTVPLLNVGASAKAEVKGIFGFGGTYTNIAIVRAREADVAISNNTARVVTTISEGTTADLAVRITDSPDPVLQSQNITYTVTVSNQGPLTATGVVLTNFFPENGNVVTASTTQGGISNAGVALVFDIGTLAVGATAQATIVVQPRSGGTLTNIANARADQPDLTGNEVVETTSVSPAANLVLTMSDTQDPVGVNQAFGYNIAVYNAGPGVADNVTIFDTLPAQFAFLSAAQSQGTSSVSGGAIIFQLGSLDPGTTANATIFAKPSVAGTFTNYASVVSAQTDPDNSDNSAREDTTAFFTGNVTTNGGLVITRTTNAQQLASLVTGSGGNGIRVVSANLQAHRQGSENGPASSGVYTLTTVPSTYGLTAPGIVLSSGDVLDYQTGSNKLSATTTSYGVRASTSQELLLDPITGGGTNNFTHWDVTQLDIVFDMLPGFSQVKFKVVFGSEEFPEFVGSSFIDGFGIFLNGQNIAFSGGKPININHPDFKNIAGTELDGVLAPGGVPVVEFTSSVPAGSSNNTLTFIISDTTDTAYDTTVYVTSLEGGLAPNADLAVKASVTPDPVPLGSNFTYRITVTNLGPDTATNTVVTDVLPNGLVFNAASASQGGFTVSNQTVSFNVGTLFRNFGAALTINVSPLAAARYTNTITAASDLADLRSSNNTAVVVNTVTDPGAFASTPAITIADAGPAFTYPSILHVSGFNGVVSKVTVTLTELSHSYPADLDILLVGPQGQRAILMSDAGAGFDLNGVNLRFDDDAFDSLPAAAQITSGVFKPTNFGDGDSFFAPAPVPPYASALGVFAGTDPNGDWKLFIMDDQGTDSGVLNGGWQINLSSGGSGPLVAIELGSGTVTLSWPASAVGYSVQSAPTVSGPWTPVAGTPVLSGGRYTLTVSAGETLQFFRLVKP